SRTTGRSRRSVSTVDADERVCTVSPRRSRCPLMCAIEVAICMDTKGYSISFPAVFTPEYLSGANTTPPEQISVVLDSPRTGAQNSCSASCECARPCCHANAPISTRSTTDEGAIQRIGRSYHLRVAISGMEWSDV